MNNIQPIPFYFMSIAHADNDQANDKAFANVCHLLIDYYKYSRKVIFLEIETSSRHQHDRFFSQ